MDGWDEDVLGLTPPFIAVFPLNLWPWNWTFKKEHIIYVKYEYFTNQKR